MKTRMRVLLWTLGFALLGSMGCNGSTGPIGPSGPSGPTGPGGACSGDVAPSDVTAEITTPGTLYPGLTYTVTVGATSDDALTYTIVGSDATFVASGPNTFDFTPAVAGGPFSYAVIATDGCQLATGTLTVPRVAPLPQVSYQSVLDSNPTLASWYGLTRPAMLGDDLLFVYSGEGSGHAYMDVWSLSAPASPARASTYGGAGTYSQDGLWNARGMAVSSDGTRAVILSDFSWALLDTTNKASPVFVERASVVGEMVSGAFLGNLLTVGPYVTASNGLYRVWDTTANTVQTVADAIPTTSGVVASIVTVGGFAYLGISGTAGAGLYVFSPSAPSTTPTASFPDRNVTGLALDGTTLCASSATSGSYAGNLDLYDVTTPSAPQRAGQLALSGNDVACADGLAYVVTDDRLAVVSIDTPASPRLLETKTLSALQIPSTQQIRHVTVSGSTLVLTTYDTETAQNRIFVYLLQ